jgi:hypothetical protein
MTDYKGEHAFSEDWLAWMRDYSQAAEKFVGEEALSVSSPEEAELISIKMALYARALTLFQGALLLAEHDRQLDFRIHARGVIEATMFLLVLAKDPGFIEDMRNDDYKSRHSRATLQLKAMKASTDPEAWRLLREFASQSTKNIHGIRIGKSLRGSDFDRLYLAYRHISADATHVTLTSLNRHYVENLSENLATLVLNPALDPFDLHISMTGLGISITIATLVVMKIKKKKTERWEDFQSLLNRYKALSNSGEQTLPEGEIGCQNP